MGSWAQQHRQPGEEKVSEDKPGVDRVVQAMWDTDIHALALRTYDELSAGERQRVAIARALVQDAPIMLLDEPTAALDIWHQLELLHHLKSLAQVRHKAVIWVTHDLNHARAHADRVLIMDAGKLAAHGKADQVLTPEILEPIYRVHVTVRDGNLVFSRSAAS
jgi:iron complex transport system ATP-binding protein